MTVLKNRSTGIFVIVVSTIALLSCGQEDAPSKPTGTDGKGSKDSTPSTVAVPDLIGNNMDRVYNQLQAVGLVARAKGIGNTDPNWGRANIAVAQKPDQGVQVKPGSIVRLTEASRGEIRFYADHPTVPNLVGMNANKVYRLFNPVIWTLLLKDTRPPNPGEFDNQVVAQRPAPGSPLRMGQPVSIVVGANEGGAFPLLDSDNDFDVDIDIDIDIPNFCSGTRWC